MSDSEFGRVPSPPLACTVRGCGLSLMRSAAAWVCARGHSYDVARSGYVNLLQPQDRKSARPGDAREAIDARAALEREGVADTLVGAVAERVAARRLPAGAVVVDLGCGTGLALATAINSRDLTGIGIDLSTAAITYAARQHPGLIWVVANADRTLPLLDRSVEVVLSLHARRNAAELARILKTGCRFVIAVPAPDDLIELRTFIQGRGEPRDRMPALIAEHDPWFAVEERFRTTDRRTLGRDSLIALLGATYRGRRLSAAPQVEELGSMEVTLASDVCVLRLR